MRHHAEHIATGVQNAGDILGGAVGVVALGIAESDPVLVRQPFGEVGRREITAVMVGDRGADARDAGLETVGEGRIGGAADQVDIPANELQVRVPEQRALKNACLNQDLKAVADAQQRPARVVPTDRYFSWRARVNSDLGPRAADDKTPVLVGPRPSCGASPMTMPPGSAGPPDPASQPSMPPLPRKGMT